MGDSIDNCALIVGMIVTSIFIILTLGTIMYGLLVWKQEWQENSNETNTARDYARQVSFAILPDSFHPT